MTVPQLVAVSAPVILLLIGRIWVQSIQIRRLRRLLPANKCPHGFTDWDDCPDCCH